MEAIDDTDYFELDGLLGHDNASIDHLRLLTDDWPGDDPLSNEIYSSVDDYFQQAASSQEESSSNEAFTPSTTTDSGNHSPTTTSSSSTSSSDYYHQQQQLQQGLLWMPNSHSHQQQEEDLYNNDESIYDDIQVIYDCSNPIPPPPPPQTDLEAIENLLNDKNYSYTSSPESIESILSTPNSSNSNSNSPPLNSNNNSFNNHQKMIFQTTQIIPQMLSSPNNNGGSTTTTTPYILSTHSRLNNNHRILPYPLILPNTAKPKIIQNHQNQKQQQQIIKQENAPQQIQYIAATTTTAATNNSHQQTTTTYILNGNQLIPQQQQHSANTIYVPTSSISLAPIHLKEELKAVNDAAATTTPNPASICGSSGNNYNNKDIEFKRKCDDRKIRNRQAAQLSRERKKAEYEQMKDILTKYEQENQELKKENLQLKQRISQLEGNGSGAGNRYFIPQGPSSKMGAAKTVGISLFVFMALVSFPALNNFSPTIEPEDHHHPHLGHYLSLPPSSINISGGNNGSEKNNENAIIHIPSRNLLGIQVDYDSREEDLSNPFGAERNPSSSSTASLNSTTSTIAGGGSCRNHFLNATERIRVNNELMSWIERHEQMNLVQMRSGNSHLIYNSRRNILFPPQENNNNNIVKDKNENGNYPTVKSNSTELVNISDNQVRRNERRRPNNNKESGSNKNLRDRALRHFKMIEPPQIGPKQQQKQQNNEKKIGGTELAITLNVQEQIMKQIAAQLNQKEDMLYVMALKDYFILPRTLTTNSTTDLPKLAIILPALSLNSSQPNHLTMMRIECSVTSTSLFYLPDGLVSLFNGSSN